MPHNGLVPPGPCRAASPRRRHPEIAPHILAPLDRVQRGDGDAFAEDVLVIGQAPRLDQPLAVLSGFCTTIGENAGFAPAQTSSSAWPAEPAGLVTDAHPAAAGDWAVRG